MGVEFGEKFEVQGLDYGEDRFKAYLDETGLHFVDLIVCNDAEYKYLGKMLTGELEYEKLPWEPKEGEIYYYPSVYIVTVKYRDWQNTTFDFTLKALGMVYRTREEAEAHFAEDFERLTGKKLNENT